MNICIFYLVFFSPSILFTAVSDLSMVKHRRAGAGAGTMMESFSLPGSIMGLGCALWTAIGSQLVFC